jgi:hypothetical protein
MKTFLKLTIACLLSVIAGCMGVKSTSEVSSGTDFASLKTYAWMPDLKKQFYNPLYAEYYMETMNSQLASRGYRLDQEKPDFLIRTHHTKEETETVKTISSGTLEFHKGTITLEFLDAASGGVIYEGEAETYISDASEQDKVKKDVFNDVEGLLKDLPSAAKK